MVERPRGGGAVVGLGQAGAPVVVIEPEDAEHEVILELAPGVGQVLDVDVELRVGVHVEDALGGAAGHRGDVPCALAVVAVDAVEGALAVGKAEVADQALRDAVGLEPQQRGVLGRGFLAVEELEAADAQRGVRALAVVAQPALLEGGGGRRGVHRPVRGVVGAAQEELSARADGVDRGGGDVEDGVFGELGLPVELADALGERDAQQVLDVGIGAGVGAVVVVVDGVRAVAAQDGDAERQRALEGAGGERLAHEAGRELVAAGLGEVVVWGVGPFCSASGVPNTTAALELEPVAGSAASDTA